VFYHIGISDEDDGPQLGIPGQGRDFSGSLLFVHNIQAKVIRRAHLHKSPVEFIGRHFIVDHQKMISVQSVLPSHSHLAVDQPVIYPKQ
jgi:hypothetical protein